MTEVKQPRYRPVFGLVVVPSVVVAVLMATLYLVAMPVFPVIHQYYFSQQAQTYATYQLPLLGHIVFASIALVLGPINLINALRLKHMRIHPTIGKCYAIAAALAGSFAIFMSFHAYPGTIPGGRLIVTSGFCALGVAWLATLGLAVRAILVVHSVPAHRFWIIANVSLTFAAVVLRVENGILLATGTFETLYPFLGWVAWVPNLAVGMYLAHRLNLRRAAHPFAAAKATDATP